MKGYILRDFIVATGDLTKSWNIYMDSISIIPTSSEVTVEVYTTVDIITLVVSPDEILDEIILPFNKIVISSTAKYKISVRDSIKG